MNGKIFCRQRLHSLCINQMLLKSLLKANKCSYSTKNWVFFEIWDYLWLNFWGTTFSSQLKAEMNQRYMACSLLWSVWKASARVTRTTVCWYSDSRGHSVHIASLNGIRADKSSAQWLTVFYWVSLMHGTTESNNLQLRTHLRYGWPIRVDSH